MRSWSSFSFAGRGLEGGQKAENQRAIAVEEIGIAPRFAPRRQYIEGGHAQGGAAAFVEAVVEAQGQCRFGAAVG